MANAGSGREAEDVHVRWSLATIVGGAMVAAACSGATVTSSPSVGVPSASSAQACSLLTLAEVGSAISFTVNQQVAGGDGQSCTWTFADPNAMAGFNTARLEFIDAATFSAAQHGQTVGSTVTPVGGLGDAAFFVDAGAKGTSLSVEKGGRAFTVSVLGVAYMTAQSEADEKTLAGYVLARI